MGFLSHRVKRSNLEAGDHIYTWRTAFMYSHHGIYVGVDKVVHFTQDRSLCSSSHSSSTCSSSSVSSLPAAACLDHPDCGFRKHRSGVIMTCLNCFLARGSLYCFEYGVGWLAFTAKLRGGTRTSAKSDPPEAVIHRAMSLLYSGFGNYDLFRNNCEDFALYCKTGLLVRGKEVVGGSGQASAAIGVSTAAIHSLPLRLFVSSPVVFGTATAVTYTVDRYATDLGVRDDVIKVKAEDIASFHGDQRGDKDACPNVVDVDDTPPETQWPLLMENHRFLSTVSLIFFCNSIFLFFAFRCTG